MLMKQINSSDKSTAFIRIATTMSRTAGCIRLMDAVIQLQGERETNQIPNAKLRKKSAFSARFAVSAKNVLFGLLPIKFSF